MRLFVLCAIFATAAWDTCAATYEVGPGKPYATVGSVPWKSLAAGDTVLIHYRSTPYNEKWAICRQGTAAAPITVRGVADSSGRRPIIDGTNAVTAPGINFWSDTRGIIKVGGCNTPTDVMPRHVMIENLEVRNARTGVSFRDDNGGTQSYSANASAIYVEKGENITIRNNVLHSNGNGLFVASPAGSVSKDIVIERNHIYGNGNVNSYLEHNSYTEAVRIRFHANRYGPLKAGALGNNLKDRSAGTVVRYNWIEGGNRQLDLVDSTNSTLYTDPSYRETFVYGNVLIEPANAGNRQVIHYGGDSSSTASYRNGTLYLYNNTVVSTRTDRTSVVRLSTNSERCDARNNIFYVTAAGNTLGITEGTGSLQLQNNWMKTGWVKSFGTLTGSVTDAGGNRTGTSPGFVNEAAQDYRLNTTSPAANAGTYIHSYAAAANAPVLEYVRHQATVTRKVDSVIDMGAFER